MNLHRIKFLISYFLNSVQHFPIHLYHWIVFKTLEIKGQRTIYHGPQCQRKEAGLKSDCLKLWESGEGLGEGLELFSQYSPLPGFLVSYQLFLQVQWHVNAAYSLPQSKHVVRFLLIWSCAHVSINDLKFVLWSCWFLGCKLDVFSGSQCHRPQHRLIHRVARRIKHNKYSTHVSFDHTTKISYVFPSIT